MTDEKTSPVTDDCLSRREQAAHGIPFVLRAWWLREFSEYDDLPKSTNMPVTGALWSLHSDPLCDQGSIDYGDDTL